MDKIKCHACKEKISVDHIIIEKGKFFHDGCYKIYKNKEEKKYVGA